MNIINRTAYSTDKLTALAKLVGMSQRHYIEVNYFKATPKYHPVMAEWLTRTNSIPCEVALVRLHWPGDSSREGRRWNSAPWSLGVVEPEHLASGCSPMESLALMGGVAPMSFSQQLVARLLVISHNEGHKKKWWREEPYLNYYQEALSRLTSDHRITFHTGTDVIALQQEVDDKTRKLSAEKHEISYALSSLERRKLELEQAKKTVERLTVSIPTDAQQLAERQETLARDYEELNLNRQKLEQLSVGR
jgi:hypothetical protein